MALSLIIGIASSLIATGVFITLSELFRRVLIPWYSDKIYRGVRIDGQWDISQVGGKDIPDSAKGKIVMTFSLVQKGDKISGMYSHKKESDKLEDRYLLEGVVRDMYFLATAIPESNRRVDGISFLMYIDYHNSKLTLNGAMLCQAEPGEVASEEGMRFQLTSS